MVAIKRNKQSRTSSRPILKTKKQTKLKLLKKDELELQKKIAAEGLSKRAAAPKGNLALKSADDKTFKKKNKSFKKVIVSGSKNRFAATAKKGALKKGRGGKGRRKHLKADQGLICLTNLPDGFFENQLEDYFSQFGNILRVRLVRSKKTGRSCGYAYIEFQHSEVANIVTQVMHNYLTFGKIIKCINMDYSEALADSIFSVERFSPRNCPKVLSRATAISELNKPRSTQQLVGRKKRVVNTFNKKMKLLSTLGVNLDLKLLKPEGSKTVEEKKSETDSQNATGKKENEKVRKIKGNADTVSPKTKTSKKKAKVLSNKEFKVLKRGLDSVEKNENATKQDPKIKKTKVKEESSSLSAESPKRRKSDVAEQTTPKSVKKSQKKKSSVKTPKATAESSTNSTSDPPTTEKREFVFEADQSEDEISFKTPPFAKKKFVKITPSSPACRVTGSPKVKVNSSKKTPQKTPQRKKK